MQKLQALAIAFTFVVMCFSGCLGIDEDKQKNRAPEALILMPRKILLVKPENHSKLMRLHPQIQMEMT